jgi:hypothetical protein
MSYSGVRIVPLVLCLCAASLCGQTQQISVVSSTYPLTATAAGSSKYFSIAIGVSYPTGLTPSSYISGTQLNSDFQAFNTAYPNPADPPEAILSSILASILTKYPQMSGGSLTALLSSNAIPGVVAPSGGSVSVFSGTYYTGLGALVANQLSSGAKPKQTQPQ